MKNIKVMTAIAVAAAAFAAVNVVMSVSEGNDQFLELQLKNIEALAEGGVIIGRLCCNSIDGICMYKDNDGKFIQFKGSPSEWYGGIGYI